MPTRTRGMKQLEEGDLFFFYRARVGAEEVRGREDVQRLYMVLAAKRPKKIYRLFVIGRMADLMSAVHDVEDGLMAPFACPYDGEVFETRARYERHMASAHPPPAVSAADIEKALAGFDAADVAKGFGEVKARGAAEHSAGVHG